MEIHRKYISLYKEIRNTVQFGRFYRLANFKQDKYYATEYSDNEKAVLFICTNPNSFLADQFCRIKLDGLDENAKYKVTYGMDEKVLGGDYLMNVGLEFELYGTLASKIVIFEKQ